MGKVKVVFDTNVWISIFTKKTLSKEFSEIIKKKLVSVYCTKEILQEITKVLFYPKIEELLGLAGVSESDVLRNITSISEFVKPKFRLKVVEEDPEDDKFLDCALHVKADFIVSGDRHLLKLGKFKNIKIITPREFLDIISNR